VEHPVENDDAGDVIVLDLQVSSTGVYAGTGIGLRALASGFTSVQGLAWAGGRVWFTASPTSMRRALWCADPRSQARRVHQESGPLKVHDAVNDQSLLITTDRPMLNLLARASGEANERDITWHALTWPRDISPDGRWLLVEEIDPVGNAGYTAFLRSIDGRVTRKLVDGVPLAFSPDGQRALVRLSQGGGRLALVDLAGGALTPLPVDDTQHLACSEFACFFPDGERIAFMARDDSGGVRLCTQDLSGGLPERLLPEASGVRLMSNRAISPDGRTIALQGDDDFVHLCPVDEGTPRPLATLGPGYFLIGWHSDGESVFAYPFNAEPPRVERLNLATGALSPWKVFSPEGSGPASSPRRFRMTPDGSAHVYALERVLSDLYVLQEEAAGSQGQGAHPPR
jgi:hypothetical protein